MTTPVPQEKATTIIEELNEIGSSEEVDDLTLNRYKHEAEKLKSSGYLMESFIILGMIACLEGDEEKMHSSHKNAIAYAQENPNATRNYAVSLLRMGAIKEAYQYFLKTYNLDQADQRFLNDIIESLYDLSVYDNNYERDLECYALRWKELTGEDHPLQETPETTSKFIESCDRIVNENPNAVSDMDSDVWNLAEALTQGVDLANEN